MRRGFDLGTIPLEEHTNPGRTAWKNQDGMPQYPGRAVDYRELAPLYKDPTFLPDMSAQHMPSLTDSKHGDMPEGTVIFRKTIRSVTTEKDTNLPPKLITFTFTKDRPEVFVDNVYLGYFTGVRVTNAVFNLTYPNGFYSLIIDGSASLQSQFEDVDDDQTISGATLHMSTSDIYAIGGAGYGPGFYWDGTAAVALPDLEPTKAPNKGHDIQRLQAESLCIGFKNMLVFLGETDTNIRVAVRVIHSRFSGRMEILFSRPKYIAPAAEDPDVRFNHSKSFLYGFDEDSTVVILGGATYVDDIQDTVDSLDLSKNQIIRADFYPNISGLKQIRINTTFQPHVTSFTGRDPEQVGFETHLDRPLSIVSVPESAFTNILTHQFPNSEIIRFQTPQAMPGSVKMTLSDDYNQDIGNKFRPFCIADWSVTMEYSQSVSN